MNEAGRITLTCALIVTFGRSARIDRARRLVLQVNLSKAPLLLVVVEKIR